MLFDDAFLHEAKNLGEESRVVMFVDVLRPDLPWYMRWLNAILVRWVAPMTTVVQRCAYEANKEHCKHFDCDL